MPNLRNQFDKALTNIEVNGQKRKRAIDAHTEISEFLQQDERLKEWGVEPLLIGSYGRDVCIYPSDVERESTGLMRVSRSLREASADNRQRAAGSL